MYTLFKKIWLFVILAGCFSSNSVHGQSFSKGYFFIQNKKSNKWVRLQNHEEGSKIVQTSSGTKEDLAQWKKIDTDHGYFKLKNKATGSFLSPLAIDGQEDIIHVHSPESNWIQWKKVDAGDGFFYLENRKTKKRIKAKAIEDMADHPKSFIHQASSKTSVEWAKWKFIEHAPSRHKERTKNTLRGSD